MPDEVILDSSVVVKLYFNEEGSQRAEDLLRTDITIIAPELLFTEVASVAAKKVRMGVSTREVARHAVIAVGDIIDSVFPLYELAHQAFLLATDSGFSAYDATYLALAQRRGTHVVTADARLVARARDAGLGHLVRSL